MEKWARAKYQPNLPLRDGQYVTSSQAHIDISRKAAQEGMVLLKNDNGTLPLAAGTKVCLFGKATFDYVKGGGGSGDVHCRYIRNLYDGIRVHQDAEVYEPLADFYRENVKAQYAAGALPGMTVEPELPENLLAGAKGFADTAIVSISRFSGEGWDRSSVEHFEDGIKPHYKTMPQISGEIFLEGDFYLTAAEKKLVEKVKAAFSRVIVLFNVGGVMETGWVKDDDAIKAALYCWQGGMEGGLAAADILFGRVSPSGKLPSSFARRLEDYPSTAGFHDSAYYVDYNEDIYVGYRYFTTLPGAGDRVVYPFGYGLSYTDFELKIRENTYAQGKITAQVEVKNIGSAAGKEVVQLYFGAPQGKLGKPSLQLAAFAKTKMLAAGEAQTLELSFTHYDMASFDDLGKIQKSAYVLEKGEYTFYVGASSDRLQKADFVLQIAEDEVVLQAKQLLAPTSLAARMLADGTMEALPQGEPHDPDACAFPKMYAPDMEGWNPEVHAYPRTRRRRLWAEGEHPLIDVAEGRCSLDEFMEQLSDAQLIRLLGGQPNLSVANTYGFGNLPEYGVPNIMTADGPAGVRIQPETGVRTTAFPCGTLLASTWNTQVVEEVGAAGGAELKENNLCVWLTPAVNIHRNPYCGRNFEYYAEDPLLVGKIGAAMVRGIQSNGVAACVKHFACNNKETNRKQSDSRLSERALREIYLKGFERIVKEGDPWSLMSSYNIINGQRASESRELLEEILRDEWGFRGVVTTDWWTRGEQYKEILAGNDIKMGNGFDDRVQMALDMGEITRADLIHCARRVLELILKID